MALRKVSTFGAAALALAGCTDPVRPTADFYSTLNSYAAVLNKNLGAANVATIVPVNGAAWPVGYVLQGNGANVNYIGKCTVPLGDPLQFTPTPPADTERTFSLTATLPAAITNGIVSANANAKINDTVELAFAPPLTETDASQADLTQVLNSPSCKSQIGAAIAGGGAITIVRGQISGTMTFTWQKGGNLGGGAQITPPGLPAGTAPIAFNLSYTAGPGSPIILTEKSSSPHFLIVQTYESAVAAVGGPAAPRVAPRNQHYTRVPTPANVLQKLNER